MLTITFSTPLVFYNSMKKKINHLIGRAMHDYDMLTNGDRVLVAVSGGIDSLVLTWLLQHWRKKAPIDYDLLAVHLDMGFGGEEYILVEEQLRYLEAPYIIEKTHIGKEALIAEDGKSGCYHCARMRRNRLFEIARQKGFSKIGFGHHQEDIIETFFLNLFYSGNMSTMVPKQELFAGSLSIIRPLAYLQKAQIKAQGESLGIAPVANPCPISGDTKRQEIRGILEPFFEKNSRIKANVFAGLANIRPEYLLNPFRSASRGKRLQGAADVPRKGA